MGVTCDDCGDGGYLATARAKMIWRVLHDAQCPAAGASWDF